MVSEKSGCQDTQGGEKVTVAGSVTVLGGSTAGSPVIVQRDPTRGELADARALADELSVRHVVLPTDELAREGRALGIGQAGDEDAPLVDVETDKAAVTIPSPRGGRVTSLNGKVGDVVNVGDVVAVIDDGSVAPAAPAATPEPVAEPAPEAAS